jgi:hypothetical protein
MSDDLDDLLRRSMKTLDDQVPTGYFDALPNRTLARLEDSSMQTTGTTGTERDASTGVPPTEAAATKSASTAERDDDSGLHDIRNLASSQRMRMSSRRISTSPPVDDDILASSSAGWKAVALPEPAKMVSLPELSELPSKSQIKAAEKAARESAKELRKSKPEIAVAPPAVAVATEAPLHLDQTPAPAPIIETPMIGSRISGTRKAVKAPTAPKSNRGVLFGIVGLGLAAAAGAAIYVTTRNSGDSAPEQVASHGAERARAEDSMAKPSGAAPPAPAAAAVTATPMIASDTENQNNDAAGSGAAEETKAEGAIGGAAPAAPPPSKPTVSKGKQVKKPDKTIIEVKGPEGKKQAPAEPVGKKDGTVRKDGEPNFDDLLKEANINDKTKPKKVSLEKKSLSGSDFKAGMAAVAKKAQACYKSTQGTAFVKLTIAPTGQVSKVSVTGPEAGCVQAAVQGASFPPWEGGPQSFNYSYLLSE